MMIPWIWVIPFMFLYMQYICICIYTFMYIYINCFFRKACCELWISLLQGVFISWNSLRHPAPHPFGRCTAALADGASSPKPAAFDEKDEVVIPEGPSKSQDCACWEPGRSQDWEGYNGKPGMLDTRSRRKVWWHYDGACPLIEIYSVTILIFFIFLQFANVTQGS